MFFVDENHRINYEWMMAKMQLMPKKDVQYEANIYIAAIPIIYRYLDENSFEPYESPLHQLGKWSDEEKEWDFSHPALTGSATRMCEFGASLFNGYFISLDDVLGTIASDELRQALIQAFKIRAKMY